MKSLALNYLILEIDFLCGADGAWSFGYSRIQAGICAQVSRNEIGMTKVFKATAPDWVNKNNPRWEN